MTRNDTFFDRLGRSLDRAAGPPLYLQIAARMRHGIRGGELRNGDVVPPQRQLSARWGIGEVTVRRALQELAGEGLLEARPGVGTAVRDPAAPSSTAPGAESQALSIGIAFADLADGYPFMQPLLEGLRDGDRSVAVRAFDVATDPSAEAIDTGVPLAGLDGVIAMSPVNLRLLTLCQERRLPCVLLFSDIADGHTRCIVVDYARGVYQAVRHLAAAGSRRIGLVTAAANRFSTGQWLDAHRDALEFAGLPVYPELIVHAGYHEADGYRATRALLALAEPPDALLFASDHQARGGLLAAHELGFAVPDRLRIVGAGGILREGGWPVPLATIDLRIAEIGRAARRLIQAAKSGRAEGPYRTSTPSQFLPGATA